MNKTTKFMQTKCQFNFLVLMGKMYIFTTPKNKNDEKSAVTINAQRTAIVVQ